jgi:hypothetical protein
MSERGEQQSCLREENNNHVRERRTTIVSERGEQQSFLREENNNHVRERSSPLSYMIVVLLSQT